MMMALKNRVCMVVVLAVAAVSNLLAKPGDSRANRALAKAELEKHLALVSGADWTNKCPFRFVFKPAPGESKASERHVAFAKRVGDAVYFWGDDRGRSDFRGTGRFSPSTVSWTRRTASAE